MDTIIEKLLLLLQKMDEERGVPQGNSLVDKNIVKSEGTTFDNKKITSLSGKEKKRLSDTFTLFSKIFFDYKKKIDETEKSPTTFTSKISKDAKKADDKSKPQKCPGSFGIWDILALALGALVTGIFAKIGVGSDVLKVFAKGGLMVVAKMIGKFLPLGFLKKLPVIGGLVNLAFAIKDFMDGKPVKGILGLVSGLLNFIPVVGPFLSIGMDILIGILEAKGMFEENGALSGKNAWGTIKKWGAIIGKKIWDNALYLPIIGTVKRFGLAGEAFKAGNYGEGLKQIGLGIVTFFPGGGLLIKGYSLLRSFLMEKQKEAPKELNENSSWSDRMLEWIKDKLKTLPWWIKKPLVWFGLLKDEDAKEPTGMWSSIKDGSINMFEKVKAWIGDIWDNLKGPMKDGVDIITSFAKDMWEGVKDQVGKAWDYIKNLDFVKVLGDIASNAFDAVMSIGKWLNDKLVSMEKAVYETLKNWIPKIVDTIANFANSAYDTLKAISDKLGGWIAQAFSSDSTTSDQTAPQMASGSGVTQFSSTDKSLDTLVSVSIGQLKMMTALVNIETGVAQTLVKISEKIGNLGSGGDNVPTPSGQASTSKKEVVVQLLDNRDGYANSPYSLT